MEGIMVLVYLRERRISRRRNLRSIRRSLRDTHDPFLIADQEFINLYRISKEVCHDLIHKISPFMKSRLQMHGIPSHLRVLCALRFFATGSYQRAIRQDFLSCISQPSVSRRVNEVAVAVQNIGKEHIKLPEDFSRNKQRFFERHGFPGVLGLIDGTHIKIKSPVKEIEHVYYCRKGGHSKNVQIICGTDLEIIGINARFGGTAHDAYIWRCSKIKASLENRYNNGQRTFWLLGDSGYPLQPWLMTPIQDEATEAVLRYNVAHKKTRQIVGRTIGLWKSVFRCLLQERVLCYSPVAAGHIINCCAILYNMRIKANLPFPNDLSLEIEDSGHDEHTEIISSNNILREGQIIRNTIVRNYFSQ